MGRIITSYYASSPATSIPPVIINPIEANRTTGWYDLSSLRTSGGRVDSWVDRLGKGPALLRESTSRNRRRTNPDGSVLIGPNSDTRNADPGDGPMQVTEGKLIDAETNDITMFFVFQTFFFRDNPQWTLTNNSVGGFLSFLRFNSRLYQSPKYAGVDTVTEYRVGILNGTFGLIGFDKTTQTKPYAGRGGRNWVNPTNKFQDKAVMAVRIKKTFSGLTDLTISFNGVRQQNVFATAKTDMYEPHNAAGFILGSSDGFMVSMYEMAYFNHFVDDTNMTAIENFLKQKHSIA
ncbi:hypothetical protein K3G63_06620 [Hymenobacter sp. HSC-4F20]|uniref:hypothetical protein n=1 Tax=Hymenobacter sp. HSC-4F20 TaxID=2864135 RepID=UPI001C732F69|nr:hypothetical protein [Hymenobacter sp. HSC-4F20]MBX0290104.1 hypothetical protein [Hymenobacter sp. HSC-4F20]